MDDTTRSTDRPDFRARIGRAGLFLGGIVAFFVLSETLDSKVGIPFAISYRVACALACLYLLAQIGKDYPGQRWPTIAFAISLAFDVGLFFFPPFARLPMSKGDLLFFGVPDAVIALTTRIATYSVADVHQRAVRQQLIMGLILSVAFCAIIMAMMFVPERSPAHSRQGLSTDKHYNPGRTIQG